MTDETIVYIKHPCTPEDVRKALKNIDGLYRVLDERFRPEDEKPKRKPRKKKEETAPEPAPEAEAMPAQEPVEESLTEPENSGSEE